jgi:hypothetical protein
MAWTTVTKEINSGFGWKRLLLCAIQNIKDLYSTREPPHLQGRSDTAVQVYTKIV